MFQRKNMRLIAAVALFLVASLCAVDAAKARIVTDMTGRNVSLPDSIRKVYAPAPYGAYLLYSLDPSLLAGLNFPIRDEDRKYYPQAVRNLPVIGSVGGQGKAANIEVVMKANPDLLLMWSADRTAMDERTEELVKKINRPYVYAVKEARDFYRLFLGVELSENEMKRVIYP